MAAFLRWFTWCVIGEFGVACVVYVVGKLTVGAQATFSRAFLGVHILVIRMLSPVLTLAHEAPISMIHIVVILNTGFSWPGVILVALGWLSTTLSWDLADVIHSLRTVRALRGHFLDEYHDCTLRRWEAAKYLSEGALAFIAADRMPLELTNMPLIHSVGRGPSRRAPRSPKAYQLMKGPTLIFVRDEPDRIEGESRFFINHEMGHALRHSKLLRGRLTRELVDGLGAACWTIVVSQSASAVINALSVLVQRFSSEVLRKERKLDDESTADAFAVLTVGLPDADLRRAAEFYAERQIMASNELPTASRNERRRRLLTNMESMIASREVNFPPDFPRSIEAIVLPFLIVVGLNVPGPMTWHHVIAILPILALQMALLIPFLLRYRWRFDQLERDIRLREPTEKDRPVATLLPFESWRSAMKEGETAGTR